MNFGSVLSLRLKFNHPSFIRAGCDTLMLSCTEVISVFLCELCASVVKKTNWDTT